MSRRVVKISLQSWSLTDLPWALGPTAGPQDCRTTVPAAPGNCKQLCRNPLLCITSPQAEAPCEYVWWANQGHMAVP